MSSDTYDPLSFYLREVDSIPVLTREEEADLLRQVMARDERAEPATRRLIEANLSLVVSVAERYRLSEIGMLELVQEGNTGLVRAVQEFSISGNSFSAFATSYVEKAIEDAIAERGRE